MMLCEVAGRLRHQRANEKAGDAVDELVTIGAAANAEAGGGVDEADDRMADHIGVVIAAERPRPRAGAELRRPLRGPAIGERGTGRRLARDHGDIGHRRLEDAGIALGIIDERAEERAKLRLDACDLGESLMHKGLELGARRLGEGEKAVALIGEMKIEGAVADIGGARDVLWPRRVIAVLDEEPPRRGEEPLPTLGLATVGTRRRPPLPTLPLKGNYVLDKYSWLTLHFESRS